MSEPEDVFLERMSRSRLGGDVARLIELAKRGARVVLIERQTIRKTTLSDGPYSKKLTARRVAVETSSNSMEHEFTLRVPDDIVGALSPEQLKDLVCGMVAERLYDIIQSR